MESHNVLDRISLAGPTKCTKVIHLGRVLSWFHGKMSPFFKNAIWGSPTNTHQKPITTSEVCSVRAGHLTSPRFSFLDQLSTPFSRSGRSAKLWGSSQLAFCVFFLVHLWEGRELWRFGGWGVRFQRWFVCVTKTSEFSGRWWRNAEVSSGWQKDL